MKEINSFIQNKEYAANDGDEIKIKHFVQTCYSKTQLMHIYHTNSDLKSETRMELDNALAKRILESRLKYVSNTSNYTSEEGLRLRRFMINS